MRSRALGSVLSLSGIVAVVFACSSGSDGAATSDDFATQYCAIFAPCCEQAKRPTDGATCRAFVGAAASGKTYDAAKASECLQKTREASAKPGFCTFSDVPSCDGVYATANSGTVQPGGACKDDEDCAASPEGKVDCTSSFTSSSESRFCQVQIPGKDGDGPCIGTKDGNVTSFSGSSSEKPSRGYICNVEGGVRCDSKTGKCSKIGDVGAPCDGSSNACVKTAYCDATQKCAPRVAVGAPCGTNGVSSQACVSTAYCDTTSKACATAAADGAPCTRGEQCVSDRCLNGKCEASSGGSDLSLAFLCGG